MCSQSRPWLSQARAPTENEAKVTIFGKFNFVCFYQFSAVSDLDCLWPDLNLPERLKERQEEMHLLKILIVHRKNETKQCMIYIKYTITPGSVTRSLRAPCR